MEEARTHKPFGIQRSACLLKQKKADLPDTRLLHLFDSSVSLAAATKGRSSSRSLAPLLGQSCALQLAAGTYCAEAFAPTRLNIADDPTRDAPLREPEGMPLSKTLPEEVLAELAQVRVKRFLANWLRLACLLAFLPPCEAVEGGGCRASALSHALLSSSLRSGLAHLSCLLTCHLCWISDAAASWMFIPSSALIGLCALLCLAGLLAALTRVGPVCPKPFKKGFGGWFLLVVLSHGCVAVRPRAAYELKASFFLQSARSVLPRTDLHRQARLADFRRWLHEEEEMTLEAVTSSHGVSAEEVNRLLVRYGQDLFRGGRPYGHYSELINAVASSRPILRKQLTGAWDLAYNWLSLEPHVHHIAMPAIVLLAFITTCLLWGWKREAGVFALMWGGLCRPGEVAGATRRHLVLPKDVVFGQLFVLLRIEEPKTRRRAAKHQSSKVDLPDLVQVIEIAFGELQPGDALWPFSGQTLRARFRRVCHALGLPASGNRADKHLNLSSFRPGGATWLLPATDNPELVRRRGRWLSPKVMEIYLQEVQSATFLSDQAIQTRDKIAAVASAFSKTLKTAARYHGARLAEKLWYMMFLNEFC